jgi:hypothetical protein
MLLCSIYFISKGLQINAGMSLQRNDIIEDGTDFHWFDIGLFAVFCIG